MSAARALKLFLRICAVVVLLAWLPVAMPDSWMVQTHRLLGLGELPPDPVVEYLARTESLLYGLLGGLLWLLSTDVCAYAPVIRYFGWAGLTFGVAVFFIDWHAGMPGWWVMGEAPIVLLLSLVTLGLLARARRGWSRP